MIDVIRSTFDDVVCLNRNNKLLVMLKEIKYNHYPKLALE